jgi:hypothetical protein
MVGEGTPMETVCGSMPSGREPESATFTEPSELVANSGSLKVGAVAIAVVFV